MKKFYQLEPKERLDQLFAETLISQDIRTQLENELNQHQRLPFLSENVIGSLTLPLSVVPELVVDGHSYTVPMATEEPSVVAAAANGAQLLARAGGVHSNSSKRDGIWGQLIGIPQKLDLAFYTDLPTHFAKIMTLANQNFQSLVAHGGGVKKIVIGDSFDLDDVHLQEVRVLVDPAEAMGANKTNEILAFMGQCFEDLDLFQTFDVAILSNYPSQLTTVQGKVAFSDLSKVGASGEGKKIAKKIERLSRLGQISKYRAVTNNKGIMNGVDAVLMATGNDYRAVEAAAHTYAYRHDLGWSLSKWWLEKDYLVGEMTLPLPLGVVGGSIRSRLDVQTALHILKQPTANELASVTAGIGLANNLAALLAISREGILPGHMKLQARNLAIAVGAKNEEIEQVVLSLEKEGRYDVDAAKAILQKIRGN